MLIGSSPQGCSEDNLVQSEITRTILLPVERQILTHSFVIDIKHGKPVSLLPRQVSEP